MGCLVETPIINTNNFCITLEFKNKLKFDVIVVQFAIGENQKRNVLDVDRFVRFEREVEFFLTTGHESELPETDCRLAAVFQVGHAAASINFQTFSWKDDPSDSNGARMTL